MNEVKKLINMNINKYFHMIPLWKSPIKLPVELPVGQCAMLPDPCLHGQLGPAS